MEPWFHSWKRRRVKNLDVVWPHEVEPCIILGTTSSLAFSESESIDFGLRP